MLINVIIVLFYYVKSVSCLNLFIPEIILFSADGKVLRRGLRGEAIAQAVEECLQAQPEK